MSTARWMTGDVFDRLAEIPDGSVDLVMTSPPFLALRSYLPADHPDKHKEIGQEPTPAEFLDTLLALTAEWRRVLAPHGSICVELGDTYSGSGGAGGDYNSGGLRDGQAKFSGSAAKRAANGVGNDYRPARSGRDAAAWPLPKSLCGIPTLYAWSLAYGRNLLTGEPSPAGQWRIRNLVAWVRPNPPVGALGDKFRPATSYLTIACVSPKRYFDLDAVRQPYKPGQSGAAATFAANRRGDEKGRRGGGTADVNFYDGAGAPPLDWWEIPTQPYSGSHYATYPEALCVRPIEAMCPRRVCTTCGEPSRRIVEHTRTFGNVTESSGRSTVAKRGGPLGADYEVERQTLGWTDCGHNSWRPGVVLDPFAGSGTTLAVATARGRDAIGIDLDPRNLDLARQRIGMWLQEDA